MEEEAAAGSAEPVVTLQQKDVPNEIIDHFFQTNTERPLAKWSGRLPHRH